MPKTKSGATIRPSRRAETDFITNRNYTETIKFGFITHVIRKRDFDDHILSGSRHKGMDAYKDVNVARKQSHRKRNARLQLILSARNADPKHREVFFGQGCSIRLEKIRRKYRQHLLCLYSIWKLNRGDWVFLYSKIKRAKLFVDFYDLPVFQYNKNAA